MWRRLTVSVLFGLGLVALTASGQPPAPADGKPAANKAAGQPPAPVPKKAVDPVEAMIESALANDPDVRMARAKIQLADAELAKARQQVAVKVITLNAAIAEQKRAIVAAEHSYLLVNEMHKRGTTPLSEVLPARDKLDTAKAQLDRLETELKLITGKGSVVVGAGWDNLDAVHRGVTWNSSCLACHTVPSSPHGGAGANPPVAAGIRWLATHQALGGAQPEPMKGPVADRLRAALDKPVRLGAKGEKVSVEEAIEVIKKKAGLDVPVRITSFQMVDDNGRPLIDAKGQPLKNTRDVVSEGEELPAGAWFQMIQDATPGYAFYVREYGLLFTSMNQAPAGAVSLVEFWKPDPATQIEHPKKKPAAKADVPKE